MGKRGPGAPPALERFLGKVVVQQDGCWLWTGSLGRARRAPFYGCFWADGRSHLAHRWFYERVFGPVPPGLVLDHIACDRPACVNPEHLAPVTHRENILRGNGVCAQKVRN